MVAANRPRKTLGGWLGAALLGQLLVPLACALPPSPAERATDAARDLNVASRFGRMDLALERTDATEQASFRQRRAAWGRGINIVDVELSGLEFKSDVDAVAYVDIAWVRADDATLRTTRLAQHYRDSGRGYKLVREERIAGDLGLLGERVELVRAPTADAHFPTRVIR